MAFAIWLPSAAVMLSPADSPSARLCSRTAVGTAASPSRVTMSSRSACVIVPSATAWLPPADAAWIDTCWFAAFGEGTGS